MGKAGSAGVVFGIIPRRAGGVLGDGFGVGIFIVHLKIFEAYIHDYL